MVMTFFIRITEKNIFYAVTLSLVIAVFMSSISHEISLQEKRLRDGVSWMNANNLVHLFFMIKSLRYLSHKKALHWSLRMWSSFSLLDNRCLLIKVSCFYSKSRFSFNSLTMSSAVSFEKQGLKAW